MPGSLAAGLDDGSWVDAAQHLLDLDFNAIAEQQQEMMVQQFCWRQLQNSSQKVLHSSEVGAAAPARAARPPAPLPGAPAGADAACALRRRPPQVVAALRTLTALAAAGKLLPAGEQLQPSAAQLQQLAQAVGSALATDLDMIHGMPAFTAAGMLTSAAQHQLRASLKGAGAAAPAAPAAQQPAAQGQHGLELPPHLARAAPAAQQPAAQGQHGLELPPHLARAAPAAAQMPPHLQAAPPHAAPPAGPAAAVPGAFVPAAAPAAAAPAAGACQQTVFLSLDQFNSLLQAAHAPAQAQAVQAPRPQAPLQPHAPVALPPPPSPAAPAAAAPAPTPQRSDAAASQAHDLADVLAQAVTDPVAAAQIFKLLELTAASGGSSDSSRQQQPAAPLDPAAGPGAAAAAHHEQREQREPKQEPKQQEQQEQREQQERKPQPLPPPPPASQEQKQKQQQRQQHQDASGAPGSHAVQQGPGGSRGQGRGRSPSRSRARSRSRWGCCRQLLPCQCAASQAPLVQPLEGSAQAPPLLEAAAWAPSAPWPVPWCRSRSRSGRHGGSRDERSRHGRSSRREDDRRGSGPERRRSRSRSRSPRGGRSDREQRSGRGERERERGAPGRDERHGGAGSNGDSHQRNNHNSSHRDLPGPPVPECLRQWAGPPALRAALGLACSRNAGVARRLGHDVLHELERAVAQGRLGAALAAAYDLAVLPERMLTSAPGVAGAQEEALVDHVYRVCEVMVLDERAGPVDFAQLFETSELLQRAPKLLEHWGGSSGPVRRQLAGLFRERLLLPGELGAGHLVQLQLLKDEDALRAVNELGRRVPRARARGGCEEVACEVMRVLQDSVGC